MQPTAQILLSNAAVSLAGQIIYRASSRRLALKQTLELSILAWTSWSSLGSITGLIKSYLASSTRCRLLLILP